MCDQPSSNSNFPVDIAVAKEASSAHIITNTEDVVHEEPPVAEEPLQGSHPSFMEGQVNLDDDFLTVDDVHMQVKCALNRDSETDSESDVEFEVYSRCQSRMGNPDDPDFVRPSFGRTFDEEYYNLPPLENLSLDDNVKPRDLRPFGAVEKIIDFVVTIQPLPGIPAMDYDSVLFDENCGVIGSIFEIFGQIEQPMYAIRFNSGDEAAKYPIGRNVFYAPNYLKFTKTFFPHDLAKIMFTDDNDGSDVEFSDDETERRHDQRNRAKQRNWPGDNQHRPQKQSKVQFREPTLPGFRRF